MNENIFDILSKDIEAFFIFIDKYFDHLAIDKVNKII